MTLNSSQSTKATLQYHGKSFYWASFFMGRKRAQQAARLYTFCRVVDDLVDKNPGVPKVLEQLQHWQKQLETGLGEDAAVIDILHLTKEVSLDVPYLQLLIQGVTLDLKLVRISNEAELIQYCYLVAGAVGLMMCCILGTTSPEAKKFAVDLGIAMQLTNIIRDVNEDACAGRQYIPSALLPDKLDLTQVVPLDATLLKPALKHLFDLSETYYKSGYDGLSYLPWRSRLSILIAARLYQEISLQAKSADFEVLQRRIVVSSPRKCWLIVGCMMSFLWGSLTQMRRPTHNSQLHHKLDSFFSTP